MLTMQPNLLVTHGVFFVRFLLTYKPCHILLLNVGIQSRVAT